MPKEWIDPRYAWLVAKWQDAQQPQTRNPQEPQPQRGFIVPAKR